MTRPLSRYALVIATVLPLACGGADKSAAPASPPPTPQLKPEIGRIVLTNTRALLYASEPAAIAGIVAQVFDVTGAEIAKTDLNFTADVPADWSVRNDSKCKRGFDRARVIVNELFPPSRESIRSHLQPFACRVFTDRQ